MDVKGILSAHDDREVNVSVKSCADVLLIVTVTSLCHSDSESMYLSSSPLLLIAINRIHYIMSTYSLKRRGNPLVDIAAANKRKYVYF